jgi:Anti-sigma-K factor rskA/Putative zinc-finger
MQARRAALHTLVGPYVLDAVTDRERADFERHVLTCEQCRDDVHGLREAAAQLAAAAAVPPRPALREQTFRAAERTRQLPPVVDGQPASRRARWFRGTAPRWAPGARPWLARLAVVTATALAVTAIVLGVHLSVVQGRMSAMERRDSAIAAILGAHDATTLTAQVRTGGMATLVMSHGARALVFTATGLPRLPPSKAYELWLMSPAGTTAAGMLPPDHHGMSGPVVVTRLAPGDKLGLTIEPSAGTGKPTSAPVVMVALGP